LSNDRAESYEQRLEHDIEALKNALDVAFKANPFRSLTKRFVIACSARTGSHLLCERLLPHGAVVAESLLPVHVLGTCRRRGLASLEAYCEFYLEKDTPRGVFGSKGNSALWAPLVLAGEFPTHVKDWKFVHLSRTDVLKQAISGVIAVQTQSWKSSRAPAKSLTDDDFDAVEISRTMEDCMVHNERWKNIFELFGIQPLRITYEELAADPPDVSAAVADFLGLDGPPIKDRRFATAPLQVQSNDLNARWEERFLKLNSPAVSGRHDIRATPG